ncbi:malate synthase A [Virgibacillus sp. DJP39]|uniref:malate synthase A n=1 Tax=Virgibacillus sp. DJP39 TaxID=3409790 RepID=UPI003BB65DF6
MIKSGENIHINKLVEHNEAIEKILSFEALCFLENIHNKFNDRRKSLLKSRADVQEEFNKGKKPDFLVTTNHIRECGWTIAPLPEDLLDRRVEITGPVDRKMIINALNSGAKTFMADFEDSSSPTWENMMNGQKNLYDAIRKNIDFKNDSGKEYKLNNDTAVLMVRPRGLHLLEKNMTVNGTEMSASLVDFGLYVFHNARELLANGSGPYFYLPKLENHLEARLWNDVFVFAQQELGIPIGSIKATVLIETIPAVFEMDEILYELKDHSAGLNCGRWDYIFSFIKKFHQDPSVLFPDRAVVTMETHFMRSYSQLAIQTCHKRGAPAIGGMAAQIPIKGDERENQKAFAKVKKDKEREVNDGHDGTWVAHPGMVNLVLDIFNKHMPSKNQITKPLRYVQVTQKDLLALPEGTITEEGLRTNIRVGIQYIAAWLQGKGAVPINNLMEDAATAEISRAQVWQWTHHPDGVLSDGRKIDYALVDQVLAEELQLIIDNGTYEIVSYAEAAKLFNQLIKDDLFADFLTIPAYNLLNQGGNR